MAGLLRNMPGGRVKAAMAAEISGPMSGMFRSGRAAGQAGMLSRKLPLPVTANCISRHALPGQQRMKGPWAEGPKTGAVPLVMGQAGEKSGAG